MSTGHSTGIPVTVHDSTNRQSTMQTLCIITKQGVCDGYFNVDNGGYGQKGCVIFKPDSISIQAGENYEVTITQDGTVIADYTVHFF